MRCLQQPLFCYRRNDVRAKIFSTECKPRGGLSLDPGVKLVVFQVCLPENHYVILQKIIIYRYTEELQ